MKKSAEIFYNDTYIIKFGTLIWPNIYAAVLSNTLSKHETIVDRVRFQVTFVLDEAAHAGKMGCMNGPQPLLL